MNTPTLQDAIDLAREAHVGQFDKAGNDYILHPLRVADSVEGEDAKIVAVLHDVVEDTPWTFDGLREAGYPEHIIEGIAGVTKLPEEEDGDEGYFRFVERAARGPLSRAVKIADLKDNMDLSRIPNPTEKDYARLERYKKALELLDNSG